MEKREVEEEEGGVESEDLGEDGDEVEEESGEIVEEPFDPIINKGFCKLPFSPTELKFLNLKTKKTVQDAKSSTKNLLW